MLKFITFVQLTLFIVYLKIYLHHLVGTYIRLERLFKTGVENTANQSTTQKLN